MNLVIGASGQLGRRVVRKLLERGEPVRAVSRDPRRIEDLAGAGAEVVKGDLRSSDWMDDALRGVKSLVLTSQGFFPPSRDNHPEIADERGNRSIIDAAKRATGVQHVVYVSVAQAGPDAPTMFGRLKYRVEEYLRSSGLPFTIIRPTTFIETHALFLMGESLKTKGKVMFMANEDTPTNWVAAEDLADLIADVLFAPAVNSVLTAGGPDVMSRTQVLKLFEKALHREARKNSVPLPALKAMRYVVGPFHPGMKYVLDFGLADATHRDDPAWTSPLLNWTGTTTVLSAIERWAKA